MRAGKLNKLIDIHKLTLTRSTISGEMAESWSTFSSAIWAGIDYLENSEAFGGRDLPKLFEKTNLVFTIRYLSGVIPTMKIVYDSENYQIKSIQNVNQKDVELQILGQLIE